MIVSSQDIECSRVDSSDMFVAWRNFMTFQITPSHVGQTRIDYRCEITGDGNFVLKVETPRKLDNQSFYRISWLIKGFVCGYLAAKGVNL